MEELQLLSKISEILKKTPYDIGVCEDYYGIAKELMKTDRRAGVRHQVRLSEHMHGILPALAQVDLPAAKAGLSLHRKVLKAGAQDDFDSFLQFVEWNREPKNKFYMPRRAALKPVVDALQMLADDKLDLLGVSLPPGVGKSTLAIFFICQLAGKHPLEPILAASHSNSFVRGVYDECLRIFDPKGEYLWYEVFPGVEISNTNAKDCRIDLGKRQRFETLEFTSLGSSNAGLYRAVQLLYCDDLVSGSEVALSRERLDKLWGMYTVDLRQRKLGDKCKELHIATRWSVHDVLGRLEEEYAGDPRAKFIVVPAMNENDESNFNYPYGLGYSTETLRKQREIMDDLDWRALFMNQPIEREGQLYSPDELQRYFELPEGEPDAIISVCDTKERGADDCVMPVAFVYGDKYYIEKIVCDNSAPDVVDELLITTLLHYKVQMSRFESNAAGGRIAQIVQAEVKARGGITKIETKWTSQNKDTKIIACSPWVKEHCLFKDDTVSDHDYKRALNKLCSWSMAGKNKHDDVPDAFAQLAEYAESFGAARVKVINRPF